MHWCDKDIHTNASLFSLRYVTTVAVLGLSFTFASWLSSTYAQVTTNITGSGLNTSIQHTTGTTTWNILGGTPSTGNTNLFHSFGVLSVGTGDKAAFQNLQADGVTPVVMNASAVNNIIGRVTGGNPSNIYGTLDSRGGFPNASLFLINPAGVVFGPGASLNVGGAVHFSTADYLRLGTGNEFFYADLAKNSTLSSAPVTAFGFLGSTPIAAQAIEVQGNLTITGGQSLSLVGRDTATATMAVPGITIAGGQISNPGGRINLVSVGTPLNPNTGGEVSAIDFNPASTSSGNGFASLGNILMTNNGFLSVSTASGPAVGQIVIRGGQLTMDQGSRLLATTTDANTVQGGIDIRLTGPMTLSGNQTTIDTQNNAQTAGATIPGGDILIQAGSLTVTGGAQILTTNNSGQLSVAGGNINVTADTITLSGAIPSGSTAVSSGLFSGTTSSATGKGGDIRLAATNLSILDGAKIDASTLGTGKAGDITINATQIILSGVNSSNGIANVPSTISSAATMDPNGSTTATGNGGNIGITTTSLDIHDGAQLQARADTAGNAGTIDITAGTIILGGASTGFTSGISTASTLSGTLGGAGGHIALTTGSLSLLQDSSISTATSGAGNGGTITITAGNVTLNGPNATIDGSTNGPFKGGAGGSIILNASNSLTVQGGAITTSSINGGGNAGTVQVTADQVLLSGGGQIASSTTSGGNGGTVSVAGAGPTGLVQLNGGTITAATTGSGNAGTIIVTGNAVTVSGATSSINSSTITGTGNAGNIQIQAGQVTLENGGTIRSASVAPVTGNAGNAGSITISATDQFQSTGGQVTTSADKGRGGDITIQSNEILLNSGATIAANTTGPLDAGNILLVAGDRIMLQDSTVTTSASVASGGNITLQAANLVRLRNGQIISSVQGGPNTSGGDITIDPQAVLLQNNSQILAQAFQGNGGNILIVAGVLIVDGTSQIDASSQLGISGQVSLNASLRNVAGVITPLPHSFVGQVNLYGQRCAAQKGGQFSSFVQGTRDGLPVQPGDFIPSPLIPNPSSLSSRQTDLSEAPNLAAARLGLEPDGRLSFQPFVLFAGCRS